MPSPRVLTPGPATPAAKRRRGWWEFGYRESRTIATLIAAIMSLALVAVWTTGDGHRSGFGPLKGGDFVFFYTAGAAGWRGGVPLYDFAALRELQLELIPQSESASYLPVYPPQAYLLFAPFSVLPYGWAALLWTLCIAGIYMAVVYAVWQPGRSIIPDAGFVVIAAAAFPPFFSLLLHGQTTPIVLLAFFGAHQALTRGHRVAAGVALGLIFVKPTWGLAVAAVVLAHREARILTGLALSAAVQVWACVEVLGPSVFTEYVSFAQEAVQVEHLLEPKPHEMHSLRSLVTILPDRARTAIWLAGGALALYSAVRVWAAEVSVDVRMGVLVMASALANPHLTTYDATVLVLPLLWWAIWILRDTSSSPLTARYFSTVTALFAAFLVPFALLTFVQVSVLVMVYLQWLVTKALRVSESAAGRQPT